MVAALSSHYEVHANMITRWVPEAKDGLTGVFSGDSHERVKDFGKYSMIFPDVHTWIFQHCRAYRFGRILYKHILERVRHKGMYGLNKLDSGRKTKPQDWEEGSPALNRGEFSAADKALLDSKLKAIELDPANDQAYAELGRFYRNHFKFQEAEDAFKKAIELNPINDYVYVELGMLYQNQGKFSQAEDLFKKMIELDPKNDNAYFQLGWVYRVQGNQLQGADLCKKAFELNPKNDQPYYELGRIYRRQGDLSRAEDSFRRAFGINPKHDRPLGEISLLYEEMGKQDLAKEYAEKARRLLRSGDCALTAINYHKLKNMLDRRGIKLVCVQYPVRNVAPLKKIFEKDEGVIFVDNEKIFKTAVRKEGFREYFVDMFAGDFGHCTQKGNMLLAQNIADVILREVFHKR